MAFSCKQNVSIPVFFARPKMQILVNPQLWILRGIPVAAQISLIDISRRTFLLIQNT
jgi:hypothetical protein